MPNDSANGLGMDILREFPIMTTFTFVPTLGISKALYLSNAPYGGIYHANAIRIHPKDEPTSLHHSLEFLTGEVVSEEEAQREENRRELTDE